MNQGSAGSGGAPGSEASEATQVGADDFLPVFIWVVLRCNVPKLQSNCEYIQAFHNPVRLMSKAGYCFINLRSAVEFILVMDSNSLTMNPKDFHDKLERAERELNGGFY